MKQFSSCALLCIISILSFNSCTKSEGEGGTSSIRGKVFAKYYNKNVTIAYDQKYAPEEDVYFIYGNSVTYGDNQNTNYDGTYEFKYLRPGKYKIYSYSRDTTGAYNGTVNQYSPDVAIIKEVEITERGQIVTVEDINIIK